MLNIVQSAIIIIIVVILVIILPFCIANLFWGKENKKRAREQAAIKECRKYFLMKGGCHKEIDEMNLDGLGDFKITLDPDRYDR